MSNALTVIERELKSEAVTKRLIVALNLDPQDEKAQSKAFKYASSVLAEVQKTAGDSKKDLTICEPQSIVQAMIDAATFQLAIDGRQHAHIVKYGQKASFQIGYRAYLFKIKEAYPDADFTIDLIFNGDDLKIWSENGVDMYTLTKKDPFCTDQKLFQGVLIAATYTDKGRLVRKVMPIPKERIDRARKAAKQDYIWGSDYFEKAKAAAIKNACKHMFASLQGLQDMIRYDNEEHHDLTQPATPVRRTVIDNINDAIAGKQAEPEPDEDGVIDVEYTEDDTEELIRAGDAAAFGGVQEYKAWKDTLTPEQKEKICDRHSSWWETAKANTLRADDEPPM